MTKKKFKLEHIFIVLGIIVNVLAVTVYFNGGVETTTETVTITKIEKTSPEKENGNLLPNEGKTITEQDVI